MNISGCIELVLSLRRVKGRHGSKFTNNQRHKEKGVIEFCPPDAGEEGSSMSDERHINSDGTT